MGSLRLSSLLLAAFLTMASASRARMGSMGRKPDFEDNMYAQLLMRAVSGTLYHAENTSKTATPAGFESCGAESQRQGCDSPSTNHKIISWQRLENIYEALRVTWEEEIPGDFVELGVWRGGASIFAAGVIKQLGYGRNVWVCDR